jgi:hypothetical protein
MPGLGQPINAAAALEPVIYYPTEVVKNKMRHQLEKYGVCVVDGVFNPGQVNIALDKTWATLTQMSPKLDRNRPETWTTANRPDDQGGMIQSMAGWSDAQMYVRKRSVKVFRLLHNTNQLDCSADGFTFSGVLKNRRTEPNKKVHFDAGEGNESYCVQGVVNLIEQNAGDACFGCYPGSHKYHSSIIKGHGPKNWYALSSEDKELLEGRGLKYTRFPLKAGSMLLFRSQTAHAQAHPINIEVQKPRIVHYVCALPLCSDPIKAKKTVLMKRKAYEENRATTHYPNYSLSNMRLFPARLGNGKVGRYRRDVSSFHKADKVGEAEMGPKLRELMGLEYYLPNNN